MPIDKKTFQHLVSAKAVHGAGFLLLIDPDKYDERALLSIAEDAAAFGADAILIGGSVMTTYRLDEYIRHLKAATPVPVIIFPGSVMQVSKEADALLYLSLVSGRNPEYLIGNHVIVAPVLRELELEAISTAYLLIESGKPTSASYASHTFPIPRNKPEIAAAHALAAEYLGMSLTYLEAGSGAEHAVPDEMIYMVSRTVESPVIVGGGIRTPDMARRKVEAGASFVVVGNAFENRHSRTHLREMIDAVHIHAPKIA